MTILWLNTYNQVEFRGRLYEHGQTYGYAPDEDGLMKNTTRLSHEGCGGLGFVVQAKAAIERLAEAKK